MVQTRAATKAIHSAQAHGNDGKKSSQNGAPSLAKKRQPQNAEAPKTRRRGKPGKIYQLNFDVLLLLAAYLHPLDLLSLARTCKSLRALLTSKSSAFVWRSARSQVKGLPECPSDLTEPEYANLVFYARCHSCRKQAKTVFWNLRRRYCQYCRAERLCPLSSCHDVVHRYPVLAVVTEKGRVLVDREQMNSFMEEYNHSPDKKQFLRDRERQLCSIKLHARKCEDWQRHRELEHRFDLMERQEKRVDSIFERLEQCGYGPEVVYFGRNEIQRYRQSFFTTSRPLTDKEWNRAWSELRRTMNKFRTRRLETVVYQPRRLLLESEYSTYLMSQPPNVSTFDLHPHVVEIADFTPFRDIIGADEGAPSPSPLFESAFAQLPALVDQWRKNLDAELAELVKIPSHLSIQDTSDTASSGATMHTELSRADADKLRLACALFYESSTGIYAYPQILLTVKPLYEYTPVDDKRNYTMSVYDRFGIKFMEEAPYIVHACGLDPNMATVEDMDRRDARLKCLSCQTIWTWRNAMHHAYSYHGYGKQMHSDLSRWQIIGDEHRGAISRLRFPPPSFQRCLLCRPCVGGTYVYRERAIDHLRECHHIEEGDIKRDVHWNYLNTYDVRPIPRSL